MRDLKNNYTKANLSQQKISIEKNRVTNNNNWRLSLGCLFLTLCQFPYSPIALSSEQKTKTIESDLPSVGIIETNPIDRATVTNTTGYIRKPQTEDSSSYIDDRAVSLMNLDLFRSFHLFKGINGDRVDNSSIPATIVIIDTGFDLDNPVFGPDRNNDGIGDRIVYSYDFYGSNDPDASNLNDHGTHVASIAATTAPGANLILFKISADADPKYPNRNNYVSYDATEEALNWVMQNHEKYNIVSVNMSFGAATNKQEFTKHPRFGDTFATLADRGVALIAISHNYFSRFSGQPGVSDIGADPNTINVSAVWDGGYVDNSEQYSTSDRITYFSQRHPDLTDILAPGAMIIGATATSGPTEFRGTSMAAPYIAGIVALAQELAYRELDRKLTVDEIRSLLRNTGQTIVDDRIDELAPYRRINPTGASYQRVNVFRLGRKIIELSRTSRTQNSQVTSQN